MMWIIAIPIIIALIFFSSFFAAAEMAFVSMSKIKVRKESKKGNKQAILLKKLLEKPDEVVSAIVVCNNLANISASILAGITAAYLFGNIGVGVVTAVMTLLIVIFGESTPKAFGIHNEKFAFRTAKYLNLITKIFSPVAHGLAALSNVFLKLLGKEKRKKIVVTEEEIKMMLDLGVEDGTIKKDEKELVEEIFDFDETKAIEVYVPVEKVVSLQEKDTIEKLIKKTVETGHSRFPIYRKNRNDVVGIVHIKDALTKDRNSPVKDIMKNVLTVQPTMKIDDILREMQKRKTHMAIIESKEGTTIGLVTLEDLIEEVFGEIRDEHDVK